MPAIITLERPDTADASALVEELEAHLAQFYPSESRHGFSVDKLIAQGVAFFVVRNDGVAAGCGGILLVGTEYARSHSVTTLRLETGIHQHAAIGLYERAGFQRIPPFANYTNDPVSRCYERRLA
jgi:putative acetyltransferase